MANAATMTEAETQFSASVELVTPEIAEKWLDTNTKNRRLSTNRVTGLAAMMTQGEWVFDGSPIRIDTNGDLVDGQHRLWAVVESGLSFEFLVLRGVAPEAMATMDTGKSRTFADLLSMQYPGHTDLTRTSALTQVLYRYHVLGLRGSQLRSASDRGFTISHQALMDYYVSRREQILESAKVAARITNHVPGMNISALALCIDLFSDLDAEDTADFLEKLQWGVGLEKDDPIYALRGTLRRTYDSVNRSLKLEYIAAIIIKAWNAYRRGEKIQVLIWKQGGSKPERFPEPV